MNITRFLNSLFSKLVGIGVICSHIDNSWDMVDNDNSITIIPPNCKHRIIMKKNYITIKRYNRWVENQSLSYTLVEQ